MNKNIFQKESSVFAYQRDRLKNLNTDYKEINDDIDSLEERLRDYMAKENLPIDIIEEKNNKVFEEENKLVVEERSFDDLVIEAEEQGYKNIKLEDLATKKELEDTNKLLKSYYKEYGAKFKLDKIDYMTCGIIGMLSAGIDIFCVTKIKGGVVKPGVLKDGVEGFWNKLLSPEKIKKLEEKYKVTYDISLNSKKTSQEVLGLCPMYHRFQSLGHDPILGFIFGVMDLMKGQMTAIDGAGRVVIQKVNNTEGKSLVESIITVIGHFLSDVGTKSQGGKVLSVPAPFTPLLQMIQIGSIEYKGKKLTVGELSKKMYGDGYNFNHFIGMSIPVILIEIFNRLYFVCKKIYLKEKVEFINNPKLTMMLTISNGILCGTNIGKVIITKNPFSINYVSWLTTIKYVLKTIKWKVYDEQMEKIDYAQEHIDIGWEYLINSAILMESKKYLLI